MIGDGNTSVDDKRQCHRCWSPEEYPSNKNNGYYRPPEQYPVSSPFDSSDAKRHRRHTKSSSQHSSKVPLIMPHDGPLDKESTYTAYLEVIGNNIYLIT